MLPEHKDRGKNTITQAVIFHMLGIYGAFCDSGISAASVQVAGISRKAKEDIGPWLILLASVSYVASSDIECIKVWLCLLLPCLQKLFPMLLDTKVQLGRAWKPTKSLHLHGLLSLSESQQ